MRSSCWGQKLFNSLSYTLKIHADYSNIGLTINILTLIHYGMLTWKGSESRTIFCLMLYAKNFKSYSSSHLSGVESALTIEAAMQA